MSRWLSLWIGCLVVALAQAAGAAVIDNDIPSGTLGHFQVDVQTGGEGRYDSGGVTITANLFVSGLSTEQVLYEYFSYVDPGNDGAGFRLDTGTVPVADPLDSDSVTSSGSFPGANGNTIDWTVTSSIPDGGDTMTSVFTFTAQTGALGVLRFYQYLDEDVYGSQGDVFFTTGSIASSNLQLYTFDSTEVFGVSHGGGLSAAQGLVNSSFAGYAADMYDDMRDDITGSGEPVSPTGVIDTVDLPAFVHPQLGPAYGPNDIVSVMAWDIVDPNATSAVIVTTLGGVPELTDLEPPVCASLELDASGDFFNGFATDQEENDTGIDTVEVESGDNLQVTVNGPFEPGAPTVDFTVEPVNAGDAARGTIEVTDLEGNSCTFPEVTLIAVHPPNPETGWVEAIQLYNGDTEGGPFALVGDDMAGLMIYEISNRDAPSPEGAWSPDSTLCPDGFFFDHMSVLEIFDDEYVADAYVAGGYCGVVRVDVRNPAAPMDTLRIPSDLGWVKDVQAIPGSVFLLIGDYFNGVRFVEIHDDDSVDEIFSLGQTDGLTGNVTAVAFDEATDTAAVATTDGVFFLDMTDPADPLRGQFLTDPNLDEIPQDVVLDDGTAYVSIWKAGLLILDITDVTNPTEAGRMDTDQVLYHLALSDSKLRGFGAEGQCGLAVVDVDESSITETPFSPVEIAGGVADCTDPNFDPTGPWAWHVAVDGDLVGVTYGFLDTLSGGWQLLTIPEPGGGGGDETPLVDADGDGVDDAVDNCLGLGNTSQVDSDQDGYGNACDADVDNNGTVGAGDFQALSGAWGTQVGDAAYDPAADLDGNGTIGAGDFNLISGAWNQPPGPSGLACAGTIPCP